MKVSRWCYLGALFIYILSFISSFSIGLYLLFGAVILLLFGLAISFKLLSKDMSLFILIGVSIVICAVSTVSWYLLVHNVDDYYIFYPFTFLV
ncbi:hypothetical protein [Fredinandcohnia quinoae]|uniref:NADH dehydrogenase subunit 6 n=1 Tax=Fredinandcohnia quinoae TaxID=2918902 RepID=A0AAW5E8A1_9BACI|nr:hypothetical protein [Fredinandcohnia sp. SECRCQ15]MCH1627719.1 hypothetical protein [Fredinandcohnia sp. SECRCQ15]